MKPHAGSAGGSATQPDAIVGSREFPMRVIAGSGRSGTTWVLDCLADANGLRPVFEPLNPEVSEVGRRYAHRLIAPDSLHRDLQAYLELVQRSDHRSTWTTYRALPHRLAPGLRFLISPDGMSRLHQRWRRFLKSAWKLHEAARRREPLVKLIRANLALGWMVRCMDARVVLIVRHPCAVVESKYRLGKLTSVWNPQLLIEQFRDDRSFNEQTRGAYESLLNGQLSEIEALALLWVIENQYALDRASEFGYTVVFYEELIAAPELQWERTSNALELSAVPTAGSRQRPSQQDSGSMTSRNKDSPPSWMERLDLEQLRQIQKVLDKTEFNHYHTSKARPAMVP